MTNEVIFSKEQIEEIASEVANKLNKRFENQTTIPVFISVLKGAEPFFNDLIKKCKFEMKVDFIQVSSYSGTSSTGVIHLKKDISENIKGKDVYIVEDIIDTGLTLNYLKQYIQLNYQPKSITIVCLIDKKPLRKVDLTADVVGVSLTQNKFLVGYGFDYNELGRNYDYIFVPSKKQLETWDKLLNNDKYFLK